MKVKRNKSFSMTINTNCDSKKLWKNVLVCVIHSLVMFLIDEVNIQHEQRKGYKVLEKRRLKFTVYIVHWVMQNLLNLLNMFQTLTKINLFI